MHRYRLSYGDKSGYVVQDWGLRTRPILFKSESKSLTIAKAQELNGWTPVDGDESTYGRQIWDARRKVGR